MAEAAEVLDATTVTVRRHAALRQLEVHRSAQALGQRAIGTRPGRGRSRWIYLTIAAEDPGVPERRHPTP